MSLTKELLDIMFEIQVACEINDYEALQIATKIQQNRILEDIFVIREGVPSAIEAIAMALGYNNK